MAVDNGKTALVLGAGGFIGNHMVNRLKSEGYWVRGVDIKYPEFDSTKADHFLIRDLRDPNKVRECLSWAGTVKMSSLAHNSKLDCSFDEVYQFAADMGGAGYIFTGEHDADVMHNSATINLNVLDALRERLLLRKESVTKVFYSSSACMYPEHNQRDPDNPNCSEDSAYPANPDSEYGWEKLFSERLYLAYAKNYGIPVRIARFHNIYGPMGTWEGGREKAPAAICRKVIESEDGTIEIWGDGEQTRSFLFIDDCIEAVRRLMESETFIGPVNIGSEEMVTINELVGIAAGIEMKNITVNHIEGPTGVRGRNSDNTLIREKLNWEPDFPLEHGIRITYNWIKKQVELSGK